MTDEDLYVNLFISNNADIKVGRTKVQISQKANFPWDGKVEMTVNPEKSASFSMMVSIPGWALNEAIPGGLYKFDDNVNEKYKISVNGETKELEIENGYAEIERRWKKGDRIEIEFPMPVRKVIADERVKDDAGKIAVQRGPVIYCAEWPDNDNGNVRNLVINKEAPLTAEFIASLLGGTEVIKTKGFQTKRTLDGKIDSLPEEPVTLIPYALWNNRGPGQMMVWLPVSKESSNPLPASAIKIKGQA